MLYSINKIIEYLFIYFFVLSDIFYLFFISLYNILFIFIYKSLWAIIKEKIGIYFFSL